jgi:hypothetical protein
MRLAAVLEVGEDGVAIPIEHLRIASPAARAERIVRRRHAASGIYAECMSAHAPDGASMTFRRILETRR